MHRPRSTLRPRARVQLAPLTEPNRKWIDVLHAQLWQRCQDPSTKRWWNRPVRVITKAELQKLVQLIARHQLPCTLRPDFVEPSMILCVHAHPATPGEPAPELTRISMDHLGLLGPRPNYQETYRCARETFYPLVKTPANLRRLKTYGVPAPEEC